MTLIIDFKGVAPDAKGVVWTEYRKIIGSPENCVIDVFVEDMNEVAYTITDLDPASEIIIAKDVAILSISPEKEVLIGISIRKTDDPVSEKPQKSRKYFDYTFKQEPITELESEG